MVNRKKSKSTKKLGAQELEKRKAPWASPIVYREGDGTGSVATDSVVSRHERDDSLVEQGPMPKPPIMDRIRND